MKNLLRAALLAALMLCASCTRAQPFQAPATPDNPCGFAAPATPWPYADLAYAYSAAPAGAVLPAVTCAPAPVGTGTVPTLRWNAAGVTGWYHCQKPDGRWATSWGAETWDSFRAHAVNTDALAVAQAADPVAALNAILATRVSLPLADPSLTPVWCPYAREMIASQPAPAATPPPPAAWIVARYSTQTSRPAYPVTNGVRGTMSTMRASVGATCDCTSPLVEGVTTYCPFPSSGGAVAMCTKVTP